MSQLAIFENSDLATTDLTELSKFLGSPRYKVDSARQQIRAWGKMGSTELRVTYDKLTDYWTLEFMIFSPDTSYRNRLNNTTFDLAKGWLEANAKFIMENMK
jgi:hypothetical protein